MSDHHRNIAVHQSQWYGSGSVEQNVILGLSDPVCQNGTISIYAPSDIVADLNAVFKKRKRKRKGLAC